MTPSRLHYWNISPVWLFYVLAGLAVVIFLLGIAAHVSVWRKGIPAGGLLPTAKALRKVLVDGLVGTRIFRGDPAAGIMHALIFWGFLGLFAGTVLISLHHWGRPFLLGPLYLWYALLLEVFGLMLAAGILWAFFRRYVQRVARLERRAGDLAVPLFFLLVVLSGFLLEGSRLAAQNPAWASWSFVGTALSPLFAGSSDVLALYRTFWWGHALLSLGLIAYIPYSKLFHILAAPASIYLADRPLAVPQLEDRQEGNGGPYALRNLIAFDACTRCGRCVEVCPSYGAGEPFNPRDFIRWALEGVLTEHEPLGENSALFLGKGNGNRTFEEQRIWHCTTCRACLEVCPVYVPAPEAIQEARSAVVEEGTQMPPLLAQALKNLYKYNNPWEATKKRRAAWGAGMTIPDLTKGEGDGSLCYFVGCTTSLDSRAQGIARALSRILTHLGVSFGTLGKKEPCCGDIARRAGEDGLFEMKVEDCSALFGRYALRDIVTSSPHCFHTFRNEYPALLAHLPEDERHAFTSRHYSQLLEDLLDRGILTFRRPVDLRVTYHDPCYLGRHNGVFDAPRKVLGAIPGVTLLEMAHTRENSLCCGGGGDRMWQEDMDGNPKMSEIRIREAAETGADVLITACPLCLIMLEDARKTAGLEERLRILDLNELVAEALGIGADGETTEEGTSPK